MAKSPGEEGNRLRIPSKDERRGSFRVDQGVFTQFVRQLVAEHGDRRGQARLPGQSEGRAQRQTVRKVVDRIADSYHVGQNALS